MRTLAEELDGPDWNEDVAGEIWDPSNHNPWWLIAIKAFENIVDSGRPNFGNDVSQSDFELELLKTEAKKITDSFGA